MSTAGTPANTSPISLVAPSGGVVRGLTYVIGDNFAVAMETKDEGLRFEALVAGPVWAAKDPTVSIEACAKVYLDESTGLITSDSAETEIGGFALALAGTPDVTVAIMLGQPSPAIPATLPVLSDADGNTKGGTDALAHPTAASGVANTAFGQAAMNGATTGNRSVGIGSAALSNMTTGGYNTAIGKSAGLEIVTGSGNSFVGTSAGLDLGNVSNTAGFALGNGQAVYFTVNEAGFLHVQVRYAAGTMKTADIALV